LGRPRHDPLAALRQRNYQYYAAGRLLSSTAMTMLQATLAWQVYEISGSAFQLGVLGMVRFLPSLGLSLVGGAVADSVDRKKVAALGQLVPLTCAAILAVLSAGDSATLSLIYGLVLLVAVAGAFDGPARQAMLPSIVSREAFVNAVTVNSTFQQLGFVSGPAVGGLLIAWGGVEASYAAHSVLVALAIVTTLMLRPRPIEGPKRTVSFAAIREGVSFVRHRPVLWSVMTLDMLAVVFSGAQALLPLYAKDILDVGEVGYGLLLAAFEVGAFATAIAILFLPPIVRAGRILLLTIGIFGVLMIGFGASTWFIPSLLIYAAIGMADQVSVVLRQTTIQLSTPDELRGRVSSVNMIFVGTSNQVGAMRAGFVAALTGPVFAVVSGGIICVAVVGLMAAKVPELRNYLLPRREQEEEIPEPASEAAGPVAAKSTS